MSDDGTVWTYNKPVKLPSTSLDTGPVYSFAFNTIAVSELRARTLTLRREGAFYDYDPKTGSMTVALYGRLRKWVPCGE